MSLFSRRRQRGLRARAGDRHPARARLRAARARCCWSSRRGRRASCSPASSRRAAPPPAGRHRARRGRRARPTATADELGRRSSAWAASIALRSCVYFGLQTFVPLWFVAPARRHQGGRQRGADRDARRPARSGTLIGGRLVDRIGRRVGAARLAGAAGCRCSSLLVLVGTGLAVGAARPHRLRDDRDLQRHGRHGPGVPPRPPGHRLRRDAGLSIGVGGIAAAGLGALADATSLRTALEVLTVVPLPALALALTLPEGRRPAAPTVPRAARGPGLLPPVSDCRYAWTHAPRAADRRPWPPYRGRPRVGDRPLQLPLPVLHAGGGAALARPRRGPDVRGDRPPDDAAGRHGRPRHPPHRGRAARPPRLPDARRHARRGPRRARTSRSRRTATCSSATPSTSCAPGSTASTSRSTRSSATASSR